MSIPRRLLLGGATTVLAGCAAPNVAPNRQALASLRRIAVPGVSAPAQPVVQVISPVSRSLGILGRIASDAAGGTRVDTLQTLLTAQGFRPGDVLQAAVIQRLAARGLTAAPATSGADATLTLSITQYGFVATGDRSNQPFRPTVTVSVQATAADGATTLLRTTVMVDDSNEAPATPTFSSFVDIENSPAGVGASLTRAFGAAADSIVSQLA